MDGAQLPHTTVLRMSQGDCAPALRPLLVARPVIHPSRSHAPSLVYTPSLTAAPWGGLPVKHLRT